MTSAATPTPVSIDPADLGLLLVWSARGCIDSASFEVMARRHLSLVPRDSLERLLDAAGRRANYDPDQPPWTGLRRAILDEFGRRQS